MKTTTIHALLALLTGAIATAQPPQQRGQQGEPQGKRPPAPLVGALDTDHDKVISAAEIAASATALATLDENGDGQLTRDEMRPQRPEGKGPQGPGPEDMEGAGRPPRGPGADRPDGPPPGGRDGPKGARRGRQPVPPLVKALDSDQDGTLSAAEIAGAPASLAMLDKTGDGELTPDEFAPRAPRRKGKPQRRAKH